MRDRHDQPRRAEAALHGARLHERLLDGMQPLAVDQRLDRSDLAVVGLCREHQAGAHQLAVEPDRTGAALALFACILRPG